MIVGDRLIGDRNGAALHQIAGLFRVGRQMQVGKKDLTRAQHLALRGLRLLDLDDHLRRRKYLRGVGGDARADSPVIVVGLVDAGSGLALDDDLVPVRDEFADAVGSETDTILVNLDFFGYTDEHGRLLRKACCLNLPLL